MARKKTKQPSGKKHTVSSRPNDGRQNSRLWIVAAVSFGLGFLSGVGFTVYKSGTGSDTPAAQTRDDESRQMELALEMETRRQPDHAHGWIRLGNFYFDSARHDKAIAAYEKALDLEPDNANVLTDLGVMYRRSDRPKDAVAAFDRAIAADPKHETARYNKGIVLLHDLKDHGGAIKAWEGLVGINPLALTPSGQSVDEMVTRIKQQAAAQ